jgi:hypothetical protein
MIRVSEIVSGGVETDSDFQRVRSYTHSGVPAAREGRREAARPLVARTTNWGRKRHLIHDTRGAEWIMLRSSMHEPYRVDIARAA